MQRRTLGQFLNANRNTLLCMGAGLIESVVNNSWLFTDVPLAGQKDSDPAAKAFYLIGLALAVVVTRGAIGYGVDYLRKNVKEDPQQNKQRTWGQFFKSKAATIVCGVSGMVETLINSSWVFTKIPLAGEKESNPTAKLFYLVSLVLASGVTRGEIGAAVDYLRENANEEESKLLTLN